MWKAGSGLSSASKTVTAATEAAREALAALGEAPPTFGMVFASPKQDLSLALSKVAELAACTSIIGCNSAGEFTERDFVNGGISVLLVSAPNSLHDAAVTNGEVAKLDPGDAAAQLCGRFAQLATKATATGYAQSTTVALVDGLSGTGERLLKQLMTGTRPFQQIVGGAAGDDGLFKQTLVGSPKFVGPDHAAVMHVFGPTRWGIGVDHGLRPQSAKMTVTRATGTVVHEIDDRPAFEAYRDYARKRGVTLTPESASPYLIANELGVYFLGELRSARAPLGVTKSGGLTCAAEIPQGSTITILDGEADSMIAAAHRAATAALQLLNGAKPAGILLFDCICRSLILGQDFKRELDAVRSVFPGVPMAGFLTYGEIARFRGRLEGWHNTTAVVVAIPE